ncbi:unnamed protein product [Vitrella brassicaformis CCMP3155]|uniref:Uncharacterized protein n=1 Tax=Vitrella brassicaformis (strain CCMP3155) TaxID=1169540 RepID=A0A0G4F5Y6_VITBC|nr:unnamed protein product [Vitrella brassicaformis CCMP3155]|eukprot:CEM07633.1 unnamed protein product [Vitrella brassicaformis CCMP3155]
MDHLDIRKMKECRVRHIRKLVNQGKWKADIDKDDKLPKEEEPDSSDDEFFYECVAVPIARQIRVWPGQPIILPTGNMDLYFAAGRWWGAVAAYPEQPNAHVRQQLAHHKIANSTAVAGYQQLVHHHQCLPAPGAASPTCSAKVPEPQRQIFVYLSLCVFPRPVQDHRNSKNSKNGNETHGGPAQPADILDMTVKKSTPVDITAPPTVPLLLPVDYGAMHAPPLQHSFVSPPPSHYPPVPLPVPVIGDPQLMSSYPPFSAPHTRLHSESVGKLISLP